jgi:hypothetical protein
MGKSANIFAYYFERKEKTKSNFNAMPAKISKRKNPKYCQILKIFKD